MNFEDREFFWDTLCSLKCENSEEDHKKICQTITYPRFLYRYRSVNSSSLEALRTNKLYFSTADYYDDPFDTFLQINLDEIEGEIVQVVNDTNKLQTFVNILKQKYNSIYKEFFEKERINSEIKYIQKAINEKSISRFLYSMGEFRNIIKKDIWSVCFSENGFNESLWLKYADQYKGFSVMYDLTDNNKWLCGKQEKCSECHMNDIPCPLYPVYYSNEKYDATTLTKFMIKNIIEEEVGISGLLSDLIPINKNVLWDYLKVSLIKKACHQYDEEWRIVIASRLKQPITREWIPYGIILGLYMDEKEQDLVIFLAKQAGIEHIYKSYIDKNGDLNAREL